MTQWHHCKVYFHYWMLQVHTQKSLQSQAANHIYLAQHCPAAGVGKQTGRQMGKALTGHCTLPPPALDAVCIRADVSYLTQRPFCHYHGVCVCEVFKDVERARYLCALQQKIISLGKLRRGFHLTDRGQNQQFDLDGFVIQAYIYRWLSESGTEGQLIFN